MTICLLLLFGTVMLPAARAQTGSNRATQEPGDLNSELRTRTWSIYAQGGLSWATGVWYQNVNENGSYRLFWEPGDKISLFSLAPDLTAAKNSPPSTKQRR